MRDIAERGSFGQSTASPLLVGPKPGKTHLAIVIARNRIIAGSRGRFFTTIDLVNELEAESCAGRQRRLAVCLSLVDHKRIALEKGPNLTISLTVTRNQIRCCHRKLGG